MIFFRLLSIGVPFEFGDEMNLEVRRKLGLALWNYDGKEVRVLQS